MVDNGSCTAGRSLIAPRGVWAALAGLVLCVSVLLGPVPARADGVFYEVKAGVLAHDVPDLWSGFQVESSAPDVNLEAVFAGGFNFLGGTVRPAVGVSVNTAGDTSHAYLDARWQMETSSGFFVGLGLGVAIHDGKTDPFTVDRKGLGSRALFHIPLEIGVYLDRHNSLSMYFEHISNANLADYNEGLDRIGVRYGYRF